MRCKQKFTIVLTKEDAQFDGWQTNLSEVINLVDVVWSGSCTPEEARKRYDALVMEQTHKYRQLKTLAKWLPVRLYDADGNQLAQES